MRHGVGDQSARFGVFVCDAKIVSTCQALRLIFCSELFAPNKKLNRNLFPPIDEAERSIRMYSTYTYDMTSHSLAWNANIDFDARPWFGPIL